VPILEGRSVERGDGAEAPPVAVVNEALARKYFPGTSAIGQRIKYGIDGDGPWVTIVGVAGNQKRTDLFQEMRLVEAPSMFRPLAQAPPADATLLVRSATTPASIGAALQRIIASVDPDLPVANLQPLQERVARDLAFPQFRAIVMGGFAMLALLLAAVGLYAVLSHGVAQRTHELGVRAALGATSSDLVRLIAVQALAPTLAGLALGGLAVAAFGRLLASLLYDVTATDPLTVAAVGFVMLIVAAAATLVPVRRAARVDPLIALRTD
jgi:putative ABC transport system permease protein